MKRFLHYSFAIPFLLFSTHQVFQKLIGIQIPFIDYYLDPLCFVPIVIPLIEYERKILFKQQSLSRIETGILFIFLVFLSEGALPFISNRFVKDWFDLIPLSLGLVWFVLTTKKFNYKSTI